MGKKRGVTRAEADTSEDAGASTLERECFCQSTDARRNGEKPASEREREQRNTHAFKHGRRHREVRKRVERDSITITAHNGARGYSWISAGDGAQSLSRNKAQGDG